MSEKRDLIFICTGSACKKTGAKTLVKELKRVMADSPNKGNYKLIKTKCIDRCKSAPLVIIKDQFLKKASLDKVLIQLKKP